MFLPALLLLFLAAAPSIALADTPAARVYDLSWTIDAVVPEDARRATLWIAVPQTLPEQEVSDISVHSDVDWEFVTDPDFGNRVVRMNLSQSTSIKFTARVTRHAVTEPRPEALTEEQRRLYTREEALVSLSPRVRSIAQSIGDTHRARYDYVLASMDYDKTEPGWGLGDTERACEVGKGNCTDFHSLFMSLSRARGVPAVFEMGYSTRPDGEGGRTGGYHCWAWFHDGEAWVPVDISEADKHPEKEDFFFGRLDANRITFSTGRDVVLPGMESGPLNYLPAGACMEIDGERSDAVTRTLSYTVSTLAAGG